MYFLSIMNILTAVRPGFVHTIFLILRKSRAVTHLKTPLSDRYLRGDGLFKFLLWCQYGMLIFPVYYEFHGRITLFFH